MRCKLFLLHFIGYTQSPCLFPREKLHNSAASFSSCPWQMTLSCPPPLTNPFCLCSLWWSSIRCHHCHDQHQVSRPCHSWHVFFQLLLVANHLRADNVAKAQPSEPHRWLSLNAILHAQPTLSWCRLIPALYHGSTPPCPRRLWMPCINIGIRRTLLGQRSLGSSSTTAFNVQFTPTRSEGAVTPKRGCELCNLKLFGV
jgi:hypothetical protein